MTAISSAEQTRRDFLYIATGVVGAVGAAATLVPLIAQMNPDASTIAAGAPVEVDLEPIPDGQIIKVFWRSKPIFIFHRTKNDIELAQQVDWQRCRTRRRTLRVSRRVTSNGWFSSASARISAAFRWRIRATMTAGSAPATARNTIPPAASGRGRRRSIFFCRRTNSSPTAKIRIGVKPRRARRRRHKVPQ